MNLIRDIRIFEDAEENIDYKSLPHDMGKIYEYRSLICNAIIDRVILWLRTKNYSLGEFNHLYLNLTPLLEHGKIIPAKRSVYREENWLRYVDAGCDVSLFNSWDITEKSDFIVQTAKNALILITPESENIINECFSEVLTGGESLAVLYKEKHNDQYAVKIFARIKNNRDLIPVIRIYDNQGAQIEEYTLKECEHNKFIMQYSSITIGAKSFKITPRKNSLSGLYYTETIKLPFKYETI